MIVLRYNIIQGGGVRGIIKLSRTRCFINTYQIEFKSKFLLDQSLQSSSQRTRLCNLVAKFPRQGNFVFVKYVYSNQFYEFNLSSPPLSFYLSPPSLYLYPPLSTYLPSLYLSPSPFSTYLLPLNLSPDLSSRMNRAKGLNPANFLSQKT